MSGLPFVADDKSDIDPEARGIAAKALKILTGIEAGALEAKVCLL